jgi:hypothetical protein
MSISIPICGAKLIKQKNYALYIDINTVMPYGDTVIIQDVPPKSPQ